MNGSEQTERLEALRALLEELAADAAYVSSPARRPICDVLLEEIESIAGPRRPRAQVVRPVLVVGLGHHPRRRDFCPGDHRDSLPTRESEAVEDARGAKASRVDRRRDADDLDVRSAEQERERADVVRISAEIGVEVDPHCAERVGLAYERGLWRLDLSQRTT